MLDYNRDGAMDLVVGHLDHPLALLENQTPTNHSWIQLRLVATKSERNAIGARIKVVTDQGMFAQWVTAGDGYLCSDESIIDLGLGVATQIKRLEVNWPSGERQIFENIDVNQRYLLIQNQDQPYSCW